MIARAVAKVTVDLCMCGVGIAVLLGVAYALGHIRADAVKEREYRRAGEL